MTSKLKKFKLPDSGVEVTVRGISTMMLAMDMIRTFPEPEPPVQKIDMGDGDDPIYERNYAHPAYLEAKQRWAEELELKMVPLIVLRSLVKTLNDEDKAEVVQVRADFEGIDLGSNDKWVWFKYVACASDEDVKAYQEFVRSFGEPTQEVVEPIQRGFRGDVQGEGHLEVPDDAERGSGGEPDPGLG